MGKKHSWIVDDGMVLIEERVVKEVMELIECGEWERACERLIKELGHIEGIG